jgi:hypothetical protein
MQCTTQHVNARSAPHLFEDGQHHCLPGVVGQGEAAVPATAPWRPDEEAVLSSKPNARLQRGSNKQGSQQQNSRKHVSAHVALSSKANAAQ